jgi:hypothetical protein
MTLYKVVPMTVGPDERWGVEWIATDGETGIIGPFDTQAEAHTEAERLSALEGTRES